LLPNEALRPTDPSKSLTQAASDRGLAKIRDEFRKKLDRVLGAPVKDTSARVRRALGFEKLATDLFLSSQEAREQIQRKVDRILGGSRGDISPRVKRALGFESLEQRLVMSATIGASDDIFHWVDQDGDTQALDVTSGSVEVHFTDNVGNTGDITEIRLLSNDAGFDVTTTNIDLINSNSKDLGNINVGIDVGGELADNDGPLDSISATGKIDGDVYVAGDVGSISATKDIKGDITIDGVLNSLSSAKKLDGKLTVDGDVGSIDIDGDVKDDISITGNLGSLDVAKKLDGAVSVTGDVGSITVGKDVEDEISIGGDLDSLTVDGQITQSVTANHVIGDFTFSDGDFSYTNTLSESNQITFSGSTNSLESINLEAQWVQALSESQFRTLTSDQVQHLTTAQISGITNANNFYYMASSARAALNASQVQALDTTLIGIGYITESQREDLTTDQVQALSESNFRYLPASQAQHLTTAQISGITNANNFYYMASSARAALNAEQVQALDTGLIRIGYLTEAQREDLTTDQVQAVSESNLRYLPASQVQHLTTAQISGITNANNFYYMASSARAALNAEQVRALDTSLINTNYLTETQREFLTVDNYAPQTSNITNVTVNENASATVINLHDAFSDVEDADGELQYTVVGNSNGTLFNGISIDKTGKLTINYAAKTVGTAQITVRATDSGGKFVETTFGVTVKAKINTPRTFDNNDVTVRDDTSDTVIDLREVFEKVKDTGSVTKYTVEGNTNKKLFDGVSIDKTGTLKIRSATHATGTALITIRATTGNGRFVETMFDVKVTDQRTQFQQIVTFENTDYVKVRASNNFYQDAFLETPAEGLSLGLISHTYMETSKANEPLEAPNAPFEFSQDNSDDEEKPHVRFSNQKSTEAADSTNHEEQKTDRADVGQEIDQIDSDQSATSESETSPEEVEQDPNSSAVEDAIAQLYSDDHEKAPIRHSKPSKRLGKEDDSHVEQGQAYYRELDHGSLSGGTIEENEAESSRSFRPEAGYTSYLEDTEIPSQHAPAERDGAEVTAGIAAAGLAMLQSPTRSIESDDVNSPGKFQRKQSSQSRADKR